MLKSRCKWEYSELEIYFATQPPSWNLRKGLLFCVGHYAVVRS